LTLSKLLPEGFKIPEVQPPKISLVPNNYELEEGWIYDKIDKVIEHYQRISFFKRFEPLQLYTILYIMNLVVYEKGEVIIPS